VTDIHSTSHEDQHASLYSHIERKSGRNSGKNLLQQNDRMDAVRKNETHFTPRRGAALSLMRKVFEIIKQTEILLCRVTTRE
jgi:hypothetical protein